MVLYPLMPQLWSRISILAREGSKQLENLRTFILPLFLNRSEELPLDFHNHFFDDYPGADVWIQRFSTLLSL